MARQYIDVPLTPPTGENSSSSWVDSSQNVLRDPRLYKDLREWYSSRGLLTSTMSDEDLLEKLHSDQTWQMFNTVSAVKSAADALTMSEDEKVLANRIQSAYSRLPAFYEKGGQGVGSAIINAGGAILADPINLIPGVNAYAKGAVAARGAAAAGRSATGAGIRAGAKAGAVSEGLISGGQEAIVDAANQIRDVQIGAQEEFSTGRLAGATALGAGLGAGVGGLIGGATGIGAASRGQQQLDAARYLGASDDTAAGLSYKAGERAIAEAAAKPGPYMPETELARRAEDAATRQAEDERAAAEAAAVDPLETEWKPHSDRVDAITSELRKYVDELADDPDIAPNVLEEMEARLDEASRLRPLLERLKREKSEINEFGEAGNDPKVNRAHAERVKKFERDFSQWRRLANSVRGTDPDELRSSIDKMYEEAQAAEAARVAEAEAAAAADEAKGTASGTTDAETPLPAAPETGGGETPVEAAPVTFTYRSAAQEKSINKMMAEEGLTETDVKDLISSGGLTTTADGALKRDATKKLREFLDGRKSSDPVTEKAETTSDIAVEEPTADTALDPNAEAPIEMDPVAKGDSRRGQALFHGIDPSNIKVRANSTDGRPTQAQVDKAVSGRAADAAPDEYAATVQREFGELIDLIGDVEGDVDDLRATVRLMAKSRPDAKANEEDLIALFDYINEKTIDGDDQLMSAVGFTKTEETKINRLMKLQMERNPGMTEKIARQVAEGTILEGRKTGTAVRGTGDAIEEAKKLTTAGRTTTGRIQSFLRRGTRISKGSDYTTTSGMRVKRNEFGFEAAVLEAQENISRNANEQPLTGNALKKAERQYKKMVANGTPEENARSISGLDRGKGGRPSIIEYETKGRETIMTSAGPQEVPKGTIAYADGYTRRAYETFDLALQYRGDKVTPDVGAADAKPAKADAPRPAANLKDLLNQFGSDPEAFRKALIAARKGEEAPKAPADMFPLKRGNKLLMIRSKSEPDKIRFISPKQAEQGKDIHDLIGKSGSPDDWDIRYVDAERYTASKSEMQDLFNRTRPEEEPSVDGMRVEAGWQTSIGQPLLPHEAETFTLRGTTITDEELASLTYLSKGKVKTPEDAANLSLLDLHVMEGNVNGERWVPNVMGMEAVSQALYDIHSIIDRVAPQGFMLSNTSRQESIKALDEIFAGTSSDELVEARDFITRLGGDRRDGPIFVGTGSSMRAMGAYNSQSNVVKMSQLHTSVAKEYAATPRLGTLYHEVAHWAYMNILTPADRREYWLAAKRLAYNEGGAIDMDQVPRAMSQEHPGFRSNLNYSPAELFATEFEKFVSNKLDAKSIMRDENYWMRMVNYVKAVFQRYISNEPIDPTLERLFAKILPEQDRGAFGIGRDGDIKTDAGRHFDKRYREISMNAEQFDEAFKADSADGIINAAVTYRDTLLSMAPSVKWAADNGKTGTLRPLLPLRRMMRQRIDDINEIMGQPKIDWKDYDETGNLPREYSDEGLVDIGDPQKAADNMRELYFNGYAGDWKPATGYDVRIKKPEKAALRDLSGMMKKNLETAYMSAERSIGLPPSAKPELDEAISTKPSKTKRKARAKSERAKTSVAAAADKETKTPRGKATTAAKTRPVSRESAESLKGKSTNDLRKLYGEFKGSDFGRQVAFEIVRKERATPLAAEPVPITKEVKAMGSDDLRNELMDAFENADKAYADQLLYEIRRRWQNKTLKKNGQPTIQPTILKSSFLEREIADSVGVTSNDGVPQAARASVRELLSYITHRDPNAQYASRTMLYRMLNLMNKTSRDVLGEANVISAGDMARLAGADPNVVGANAFVDFRANEFKTLRKDLRRLSVGLTKGDTTPIDVMHEIGHAVFRSGMLPEEEMGAIREAYRMSNDALKSRMQKEYGQKYAGRTEPLEDLIAEEWAAEGLAHYMMERVTKGDIIRAAIDGDVTDLRLRGSFSRAFDRALEYVAYIVNGLVGRNDIKQQYRRLFLFGDMLDRPNKAPLASRVRDGAVSAQYATDAVADYIMSSPKSRLAKIEEFVGNGLSRSEEYGSLVEWYHGTPAGYAFNKETNPDVAFKPSRTGQYGPGVYLTKSAAVASEVYSKKPTTESVMRQIQDLQSSKKINNDIAAEMAFATKDLYSVRTELSKMRRKFSEMRHHNIEKDRVEYVRDRIEYLVDEERELNDFLVGNGIKIEPMVIPTFVRVMNPADFRVNVNYTPSESGTRDALAQVFVDHAEMMDNMDANALRKFQSDTQRISYNGKEMYDRIVQLYTQSGRSEVAAKNEISEVLDDNGYDGIRSTHYNTLGIDGTERMTNGDTYEASLTQFEALTVFDLPNVKHVDADEFDEYSDLLFNRSKPAMPEGVTGQIVGALQRSEILTPSDLNPASLGEYLEGEGASPGLTSAIMSMLRRRKLDVKEEDALRKVSPMWWLQSQSERMRGLGINWIADWYEKSFRDVQQKFAGKYMPMQRALRELPDADGVVRNWARRATAGVGQEQPKSYSKIVRALRHGRKSRHFAALDDQEKKAYNLIRNAFSAERQEMLDAGIYVGDRGEDYVPQVWKEKHIQENKDRFIDKMTQYYYRERTAKSIPTTAESAKEFAEGMYETLAGLGENGVFVPIKGGSRNPKFENVDFSRVIELEKYPDMMAEMEEFLEDDLEFLLVKYFEGSTRKIAHANGMGINSHAFYDYMMVADGGEPAIVQLLTRNKEFRSQHKALNSEGWMEEADLVDTIPMPFVGKEAEAQRFVGEMTRVFNEKGIGAARRMLDEVAPRNAEGQIPLTYKRRVDAILGALTDYKGKKAPLEPNDFEFMENALRIAMKKPQVGHGSKGVMAFTRGIRQFNAVSLLGFTTLTSFPDTVMPIIRGGSITDWSKAVTNLATDKEYRQFFNDLGVAIENITHERMVNIYGAHDSRFSSAFFNATMLTPWTDMNRTVAGATGYELFKTWQRIALNEFKEGADITMQSRKYKEVARAMKQYGMGDFLPGGAKSDVRLSDRRLLADDEQVRNGVLNFADKTIFQPKGDDIPAWAQTPWGQVVFQLKSYPLMMSKLAAHTLREFKKGNVRPLMYLVTLGSGAGMVALGAKDIIQGRGGEENREAALRDRTSQLEIAKKLGFDPSIHGDVDTFIGWWLEGTMAMGGFGLVADIFYNAATQMDNGAYGKMRMMSALAGPIVGDLEMVLDMGAGAQALAIEGGTNSKERQAVRQGFGRIPILGGITSLKENVVDAVAGEPTSRKKNPWTDLAFDDSNWNINWND